MIKLYRHQQVALAYMRCNKYFALFAEQGCGKTIPTLFRILELLKSGKITNALVIAPNSVVGSWERDIEKFDDLDRRIFNKALTITTYDLIWRRKEFEKDWGCIALDEAHFIKNRTSNRAKAVLKLACRSEYRYILTGTPISNGQFENIWSLYTFLSPKLVKGKVQSNIFGGSYYDFEKRYCILNQYYRPYKYIHVEELQEIINRYSYRIKKVDCLDLPEKLPDEIRTVELQEKSTYKKLMKESALLDYGVLAENPLTRSIKLRQLCSGFINTDEGIINVKCEKIKVLEEILETMDKKVVIFAEFKNSIKSICELLKKLKLKYVVQDGDQKDKKIWRKFQEDEKINVIVCQYESASEGIDLFASDTIIYFEPTIRSIILEQSRDRIHRTGQKNKCSYIHLLTKGTVEMCIYRTLSNYGDFNEKVFTEYMREYTRSYTQREVVR